MAELQSANGTKINVSATLPTGEPTAANMESLSYTNAGAIAGSAGSWGDVATNNSEDFLDIGAVQTAGTPQKATNPLVFGANKDDAGLKIIMAAAPPPQGSGNRIAFELVAKNGATVRFIGSVLEASIDFPINNVVKVNTQISVYSDVFQTLGASK